jgi:hypothetical protein
MCLICFFHFKTQPIGSGHVRDNLERDDCHREGRRTGGTVAAEYFTTGRQRLDLAVEVEPREGPSGALLDEIVGRDHIVRQTSRIPSEVRQESFDIPV